MATVRGVGMPLLMCGKAMAAAGRWRRAGIVVLARLEGVWREQVAWALARAVCARSVHGVDGRQ